MTKSEFVYTTYIKTTPEKLWSTLSPIRNSCGNTGLACIAE